MWLYSQKRKVRKKTYSFPDFQIHMQSLCLNENNYLSVLRAIHLLYSFITHLNSFTHIPKRIFAMAVFWVHLNKAFI